MPLPQPPRVRARPVRPQHQARVVPRSIVRHCVPPPAAPAPRRAAGFPWLAVLVPSRWRIQQPVALQPQRGVTLPQLRRAPAIRHAHALPLRCAHQPVAALLPANSDWSGPPRARLFPWQHARSPAAARRRPRFFEPAKHAAALPQPANVPPLPYAIRFRAFFVEGQQPVLPQIPAARPPGPAASLLPR